MSVIDRAVIGLCEFAGHIPVPFIVHPIRNIVSMVAASHLGFAQRDAAGDIAYEERQGQGHSRTSLPALQEKDLEGKGQFGLKDLSGPICHLPSKEGHVLINESIFINLSSYTVVSREDFETSKTSLNITQELELEEEAIIYSCPKTAKTKCVVLDGEYSVEDAHVKSYRYLSPQDENSEEIDVYRRKVIDDVTVYANNFIVKLIATKIPLKFHPTVLLSKLFLFIAEKTNKPKLVRLCQRILDIVLKTLLKVAVVFAVAILSSIIAPIIAISLGIITGVGLLFGGIFAKQSDKGENTFLESIITSCSQGKFTEIFSHIKEHGDLKEYITGVVGLVAVPILLAAGLSTLLIIGSVVYGFIAIPYSIYEEGKESVLEFKY